MYIWEAIPTIDDFGAIDWQRLVLDSQDKTCRAYKDIFHDQMRQPDVSSSGLNVYALLSYICDLNLRLDSPDSPFSDLLGDEPRLVHEQCNVLQQILPTIQDAELRARVADILWVRRVGDFFQTAQIAIRAYLESAGILEDPYHWVDCERRINRALQLALALGQNNNTLLQQVLLNIENLLEKYQGQDPLFLSTRLLQHLYDVRQGDAAKYAALAETVAAASESQTGEIDWLRVRTYWELASKFYSRIGDETKSRWALENAAETHVKEAESLPGSYPQRSAVAVRHIQSAIEAYRQIPGTTSRRGELHKVLLAYQSESVSELEVV